MLHLRSARVDRVPVFKLPRAQSVIEVTAAVLLDMFLPDDFVLEVVQKRNQCVESRLTPERRERPITAAEVFYLFTIIYYLGVVKVPDKHDLWSTHRELPSQALETENGMSRNRFSYIWLNLFFIGPSAGDGYDSGPIKATTRTKGRVLPREKLLRKAGRRRL